MTTPSRLPSRLSFGAACLVLILFRFRAFDLPLETDECNYAYIGGRLLAGDRLYVDVWDHQPPGAFLLFAAAQAIFGDSPVVYRGMAVAFSLLSLAMIAGLLRSLSGATAARLGTWLFALVSSDPGTAGEGCNREIFMNTLLLAAWRLAAGPGPIPPFRASTMGMLLGLSSLLKPIVLVHWLLLGVALAVGPRGPSTSGVRRTANAASLACFVIGPLAVWAATCAYFAAAGRWLEFTDALFLTNVGYLRTDESWFARFALFFSPPRFPRIFDSAMGLWIGAAASILWLLFRRRVRARGLILAFVSAAFLAICLPGQFWPHYYHLAIPPAVIALSAAVGDVARRIRSLPAGNRSWRLAWPAIGLQAVWPVWVGYTQARDYLLAPPLEVTIARYATRDFWGRAQGENVRRATQPEDRVFVYGHDASIYYYSGRRCASRFTMITGLREGYPGAEKRRAQLIADLKRNPPALVLLLFDEPPFPEWQAFLVEHYQDQPVGWDLHDRTRQPILYVLARTDRAIPSVNWDWDRSEIAGDGPRR